MVGKGKSWEWEKLGRGNVGKGKVGKMKVGKVKVGRERGRLQGKREG